MDEKDGWLYQQLTSIVLFSLIKYEKRGVERKDRDGKIAIE